MIIHLLAIIGAIFFVRKIYKNKVNINKIIIYSIIIFIIVFLIFLLLLYLGAGSFAASARTDSSEDYFNTVAFIFVIPLYFIFYTIVISVILGISKQIKKEKT